MKKLLLIAILMLALVLTVVACGDDKPTTETTDGEVTTVATPDTDEPTTQAPDTDEPATQAPDTQAPETTDEPTTDAPVAPTGDYTVNWVVDGEIVEVDEGVALDGAHRYNGALPTKEDDGLYTYSFTKWSEAVVDEATKTVTYTAIFSKTVVDFVDEENEYDLFWKYADDETVYPAASNVLLNEDHTAWLSTPAMEDTAQYTYTFIGWSAPEVDEDDKTIVYTALFSKEIRKYTVTFQNWDGTPLQVTKVAYGTVPTYIGKTPIQDSADEQVSYTFKGWDEEIVAVTGDVTYIATYTETVKKYTITWIVDGDESTAEVEYGKVPTFEGTPVKAADDEYTYTFTDWTPEVVAVTGDATYTAEFKKTRILNLLHHVTFDGVVEDACGSEIETLGSFDYMEEGKVGQSLEVFSNDIKGGVQFNTEAPKNFTVAFWAKTRNSGAEQILFGNKDSLNGAGFAITSNDMKWRLRIGKGSSTELADQTLRLTKPEADEWYHIVVVVDRTNKEARLSLNFGEFQVVDLTDYIDYLDAIDNGNKLTLGNTTEFDHAYRGPGGIDDFRFYEGAFIQEDVTALKAIYDSNNE